MRNIVGLGLVLGLCLSCDDASLFGRFKVADSQCQRENAAGGPPCAVPLDVPTISGPTKGLATGRYPVRYTVRGLSINPDAQDDMRPRVELGSSTVTDFQILGIEGGGVELVFSLPPDVEGLPSPEGRLVKLLVTASDGRSVELPFTYLASLVRPGARLTAAAVMVKSIHVGRLDGDAYDDVVVSYVGKSGNLELLALYGTESGNLRKPTNNEFLPMPVPIANSVELRGVVFSDFNQGKPCTLFVIGGMANKLYYRCPPMVGLSTSVSLPVEPKVLVAAPVPSGMDLVAVAITGANPPDFIPINWKGNTTSPDNPMMLRQGTSAMLAAPPQWAFSYLPPVASAKPMGVTVGGSPVKVAVVQAQFDGSIKVFATSSIMERASALPVFGDVTGDGIPDLMLLTSNNTAILLSGTLNNGDVAFTKVPYAFTNKEVHAAAILPLDSDRSHDLATASISTSLGQIEMYRMGYDVLPPVVSHQFNGGNAVVMASGQMNGDQSPDLVVAWTNPNANGEELSVTTLISNEIP